MTSTSSTHSSYVVVSSIRAKGTLPKARYFLRISLGKQELETTKVKPYKSELEWATPLTLTIEEFSSRTLTLELYSIEKDSVIPFTKKSSPAIVGKSNASWDDTNSQGSSRELPFDDVAVSVSFILQVSTVGDTVKKALEGASQATHGMKQSDVVENLGLAGEIMSNLQPAFDAAQPFLEKFEAVVAVMDKVAKVHPYLNVAWVVLSAIPKVYIREIAQNKQVMGLLELLNETHRFTLDDEKLQQVESENIQELTELLANHTRECAYFIESYASKSHKARLIKTIFASPEKTIDDLLKRLEDIQNKLTTLLTQFTAESTAQIKTGVDIAVESIAFVGEHLGDLKQEITLNDIPFAGGVTYNVDKCCLPKTRTSLLQEIRDWVDCFEEEEAQKVFVLTGLAGSGKSSIAHSICDHYDQLQRLGSSFFFVRSTITPGGDKVFSTIARDIADKFPLFKASLVGIVGKDRSLRQTNQPKKQFQSFIVKPSKALAESDVLRVGPILIVIDALDECPEESKEDLVQALVDDLSCLPSNFRVLITSRPEEVQDLREAEFVRHVDLGSIGPAEAEADIRLFFQHRLAKVSRKLDDPKQKPHHQDWLEQLVQRSEGLFIWAETACVQIASTKSKSKSRTPSQRLDDILKEGGSGIDDLYKFALEQALGDDEQTIADFKALMARLVILKWPMSVNELDFMQSLVDGNSNFPSDVSTLVSHLGAVLGGALNLNEPIHFLHTSFRDFLLDEQRSGSFCIIDDDNFAGAHLSLANTCSAVLRHLKSKDDPRLTDKANHRSIAYSFLFAKHLEDPGRKLDVDLLGSIDTEAMLDWRGDNFLPEHGATKESNAALDGWISLVKLKFNPEELMTKLRASPPTDYSWTVSANDQNPFKLRSRGFHMTVFNPTWSTSVCCLAPNGCLHWGDLWVAFISPGNTVLVWSPSDSKYVGQPIQLGEDAVVQMTLSYNGNHLAALTSEHHLILFDVVYGGELGRVVIDPSKGLPTWFAVYGDDLALLNFPNAEESSAFDILTSKLYRSIDDVTRLSPSVKDMICDAWEKTCRFDVLS